MISLSKIFELSTSNTNRLTSMEGLRGLAVMLIFFPHFVSMFKPWIDKSSTTHMLFEQIFSIGHMGVDLFFILSGYLIYGALIVKEKPFVPYMKRRIQRIYPTFIVVFLAYLALSFIFPNESKLPILLSDKLMYIFQNLIFMPGLFDITPIMTVAWTLSYEFFYYLVIPILILVTFMRSWATKYKIMFFLFISVSVFLYYFINMQGYKHGGYLRLLMFISGVLLFEVIHGQLLLKFKAKGLFSLGSLIIIMILIDIYQIESWYRYLAIFILLFILCLDSLRNVSFTNKFFLFKPLRYLGNMSYSYYLVHSLALKAMFMIFSKIYPPQGTDTYLAWCIMFVFFLLTLIPSSVLFILIEKPFSLTKKNNMQSKNSCIVQK